MIDVFTNALQWKQNHLSHYLQKQILNKKTMETSGCSYFFCL